MDPHPSKLEKNLDTLLAEMGALKQLKSEMQRKMGHKMKSWQEKIEAQEHELDEIQRELEQLQTPGYHRDKFNIRHKLNKRVIECLSVVEALQTPENMEVSRENGNEVETLISELEMLKPQRYSYDQLKNIITSDVIIGQGGFGEVYEGKIGKVEVAVKVLREEHREKVMEKQFMNEMRTMYLTSHQHLVKFYGYCFEPEKKALIYEYMTNKSLDKHLYKKRGGLPWDMLYNIAIGTAKGIAHLHESDEKPIIHYDIKAANVLLDSKFSPKVTDFGLSKIYEKDVSHVIQTSIGGTALYAAPEVSLGSKAITYKCDVFSFGLMLLEILSRKRITKNFGLKVWESLQNGMLENLLLNCGIEKKDIKQAETFAIAGLWCIQFNPNIRPCMSDVVKVLQGVMQLPSDPPNPDTYGMFASGSYVNNEGSDDDDEDDDTVKVAKTPEESIQDELRERFMKVQLPMKGQLKEFQSEEINMRQNAKKEYNLPPTEAISSIQNELKRESSDDDDEDDDDIASESSDDDDEESWRKPKYASTSNLNNPVRPRAQRSQFKTPEERYIEVQLSMQNKQGQPKELSMEERNMIQNAPREHRLSIIQNARKQRFSNVSSSQG